MKKTLTMAMALFVGALMFAAETAANACAHEFPDARYEQICKKCNYPFDGLTKCNHANDIKAGITVTPVGEAPAGWELWDPDNYASNPDALAYFGERDGRNVYIVYKFTSAKVSYITKQVDIAYNGETKRYDVIIDASVQPYIFISTPKALKFENGIEIVRMADNLFRNGSGRFVFEVATEDVAKLPITTGNTDYWHYIDADCSAKTYTDRLTPTTTYQEGTVTVIKRNSKNPHTLYYSDTAGACVTKGVLPSANVYIDPNGGEFKRQTELYNAGKMQSSGLNVEGVPTKDGVVFDGWKFSFAYDLSGSSPVYNLTLTAQWKEPPTYIVGGATFNSVEDAVAAAKDTNSAVELPKAESSSSTIPEAVKDVAVKVEVAAGAVVFNVAASAVAAGATLNIVESDEKVDGAAIVYEITLVKDGSNVSELGGSAVVTLPVPPALEGKKVAVFFVDDNGTKTAMENVTVADGKVSFATTHFSTYSIEEDPIWTGAGTEANPYVIGNVDGLVELANRVNAGETFAGQYFKLGADIDLADTPWSGIGVYKEDAVGSAFQGTFDGNGKKISGVTFATTGSNKYRGFFNQIYRATIKNVTIEGNGFGYTAENIASMLAGIGGAVIAGHAIASTIEGCVAEGSFVGTHNVAGIVVLIQGSTIKNCTNKANLTGSYTKLAGIVNFSQHKGVDADHKGSLIEGCVNEGTLTSTGNGANGVGGIIGWIGYGSYGADANSEYAVTIKNCENKGAITGTSDAKVGQIVGSGESYIVDGGSNKGLTTTYGSDNNGYFAYATVENGVATYTQTLTASNTYLVKAPSVKPTITLAAGESITFDQSLATINDATGITAVEGDAVKTVTTGAKTTYLVEAKCATVNGEKMSLSAAFEQAKANNGTVITLSDDVTLSAWESVDMTGATCDTLTIDGNGKTITGLTQPLIKNMPLNPLTVKNLTFKDVAITGNSSGGFDGAGVITAGTAAAQDITIDGVTVDGGTISSENYAGGFIGYYQGHSTGDLVVRNCVVKNLILTSSTGGSIGAIAGHVDSGTATVENTVVGNNTMNAAKDGAYREDKTGVVFGTTLGCVVKVDVVNDEKCHVAETEITKVVGRMNVAATLEITDGEYFIDPTTIGTSNDSVTEIVPVTNGESLSITVDGEIIEKADKFFVAKAKIGEGETAAYYATIQEAIDATGGDTAAATTITLIGTVRESGIKVAADNNVIIDLSGKTVTGDFMVHGKATIRNGVIDSTNPDVSAVEANGADADLTLDGLTVTSLRHAVRVDAAKLVTINGGRYETKGTGTVHGVHTTGASEVVINDGTFIVSAESSGGAVSITSRDGEPKLTVNGGSFSGATGELNGDLNVWGGTATIIGGTFGTVYADQPVTIVGGVFTTVNKLIKSETITGGLFGTDPKDYLVRPYVSQASTEHDGMYEVVKATNWIQLADTAWFENAEEGTGTAEKPYAIATAEQLGGLAKLVSEGTALFDGQTIALSENAEIDLSGLTWPGIGTYSKTDMAKAFKGTFDGNGAKITGVTFADNGTHDDANTYRGFFNQIYNATVKNVTIVGNGFGETPPSGETGGAMIVGHAWSSTIENCVAEGVLKGTHNVAGIVVRISTDATTTTLIKGCVNKATLESDYTKIGGIVALSEKMNVAFSIEGCRNEGVINTTTTRYNDGNETRNPNMHGGVGGIIGWAGYGDKNPTITIKDCSNTGIINVTDKTTPVGQFAGSIWVNYSIEGTNTGLDDTLAVDHSAVDGLSFATVNGDVATYTKTLEAGNTYLVTAPNTKPAIMLQAGESITFDASLITYDADGITAASVLMDSKTDGNKTTYTAALVTVGSTGYTSLDTALAALETATDKTVTIYGAVTFPADFTLTEDVTIKLADGVTDVKAPIGYEWSGEYEMVKFNPSGSIGSSAAKAFIVRNHDDPGLPEWVTLYTDVSFKGQKSLELKLYSGEKLLGISALKDDRHELLTGKDSGCTAHFFLNGSDPEWWKTTLAVKHLLANEVPDKMELWIDDVKVDEGSVYLSNSNDNMGASTIHYNWGDLDNVMVAKIDVAGENGETEPKYYDTLQEAIDAAAAGETVTLLGNTKFAAEDDKPETQAWVKADDNVIIDLNQNTVDGAFFVNGTATIQNGVITNGNFVSGIETKGTLILKELTVVSDRHGVRVSGGTTTIESGTYQTLGTTDTRHAINASGDDTVLNIQGGTFYGAGYANLGGEGNCVMDNGCKTVTISGGTFLGANGVEGPICADDGLVISGGTYEDSAENWRYDSYLATDKKYLAIKNADNLYEVVEFTNWAQVANTSWYNAQEPQTAYTLSSAEQLAGLAKLVNDGTTFAGVTITLGADIDLSGVSYGEGVNGIAWTPIGAGTTPFAGHFNGDFKTISNLKVATGADKQGLFGAVKNNAESRVAIKNVTLNNVHVGSGGNKTYVGALIGEAFCVDLEACHVTGTILVTGFKYVGGLVGGGYIKAINCSVVASEKVSVPGNVVASYQLGGIIGIANTSKLTNCTVSNLYIWSKSGGWVGGIVGHLGERAGYISGCTVADSTIDSEDKTVEGYVVGNIVANQGYSYYIINNSVTGVAFTGGTTASNNISKDTLDTGMNTVSGTGVVLDAAGKKVVSAERCEMCSDSLVAEGSIKVDNGDGTCKVFAIVAKIGDTPYATIQAAIDAAEAGDEILVVADTIAFPSINKSNVTIKSEIGTKVTNAGSVVDGVTIDGFEYTVQVCYKADNVTFMNCVFSAENGLMESVGADWRVEKCEFTGKRGIRNCYASGTWTIQSCVFTTSVYGIHFNPGDNTVINVIDSQISAWNSWSAGNTVNFTDCIFSKTDKTQYAIVKNYGKMTLTKCEFDATWPKTDHAYAFVGNEGKDAVTELYDTTYANGDVMLLNVKDGIPDKNGIYVSNPEKDDDGKYTGGTFAAMPNSGVLADGFVPSVKEDGSYSVEKATNWIQVADTSWYNDTDTEFTISTARELAGLAKLVNEGNNFANKTVTLYADIDLGAYAWTPIGTVTANPFGGSFDGGEKTISNLKIDGDIDFAGLFGRVGYNEGAGPAGTVKNVKVCNADITGDWYVAAVVGAASVALIDNCDVTGTVRISGYAGIGGVVGNGVGTIKNCDVNATVNISGTAYVGGIVGNGYFTIDNCHVDGMNADSVSINAESYVGGIQGFTGEDDANKRMISNCSAKNLSITGVDTTGGIVGMSHRGVILMDCSVNGLTLKTTGTDGTIGTVAGTVNGTDQAPSKLYNCTFANTTVNGTAATTETSGLTSAGAANANYFVGSRVRLDENNKVTHGTFTVFNEAIADKILAPRAFWTKNDDATYTVQMAVAEMGDTKFTTLQAAIDAALDANGGTVKLLADVDESVRIEKSVTAVASLLFSTFTALAEASQVTLDLNGHTVAQVTIPAGASLKIADSATAQTPGKIEKLVLESGAVVEKSAEVADVNAPAPDGYTWSNNVLTANKQTVTVTVSPVGSGTVTGIPTGDVDYGTTFTLTAVPEDGYVFAGWTGDFTELAAEIEVEVAGDVKLTANFVPAALYTTMTNQVIVTYKKDNELISIHDIQNMSVQNPTIEVKDGTATVGIQLMNATTLQGEDGKPDWSVVPLQSEDTEGVEAVVDGDTIKVSLPAEGNIRFFRFIPKNGIPVKDAE